MRNQDALVTRLKELIARGNELVTAGHAAPDDERIEVDRHEFLTLRTLALVSIEDIYPRGSSSILPAPPAPGEAIYDADVISLQAPLKAILKGIKPSDASGHSSSGNATEQFLTNPRLFISHSAKDEELAKALIDLLEMQFSILDVEMIRSTSVSPYESKVGPSANATLRRNIKEAKPTVVALITPDSIRSSWVLFELGAAWALERKTYPLLARGADFESLQGPTYDLQALRLTVEKDVYELLDNLTDALGEKRQETEGSVNDKVKALVEAARVPV